MRALSFSMLGLMLVLGLWVMVLDVIGAAFDRAVGEGFAPVAELQERARG